MVVIVLVGIDLGVILLRGQKVSLTPRMRGALIAACTWRSLHVALPALVLLSR